MSASAVPGSPRGRYAPSPTGELHLGNASSALLGWLSVRSRGGTFVMRVEDLDRNRVRSGMTERILGDLAWLGLDWDEGPDLGGAYAPYDQESRLERYRMAFSRLKDSGCVYPCFCSRKDIAVAASAPHAPDEELRYPGTCRALSPADCAARIEAGQRHAWRFKVPSVPQPPFSDLVHGAWGAGVGPQGDFVVYRSEGLPAYQLAVVVDDAQMKIDEVVRGDDLLPSTLRQLLLFEALSHRAPVFGHVPLLLGPDGIRLSKRHAGTSIRELRDAGFAAEQIVGRLAHLLGLQPTPRPLRASELRDGFSLGRIRPAGPGIRVDTAAWIAAR